MRVLQKATATLLIIGSLLALQLPMAQAASLEFRTSKVHALLNFAETAIGQPHRSKTLQDYAEKNFPKSPQTSKALTQLKSVYQQLGEGYEFQGFPGSRKQGTSVGQMLLTQSAFAKDLKDFETRTTGIMPMAAHVELMDALRTLEPAYDKHVWTPSLKKLEQKKAQLQSIAAKANLNELFQQATRFYRSKWPAERTFLVSLYPIPGNRGYSSAESLDSVESVGVLIDDPDDIGRFGVLFHEICHSLYEGQSPEFQAEFEKWFTTGTNAHGNLAYHRINEALATALGNGLAFERAAGKLDNGSWYNDKYIEGFSRGIYPKVKDYITGQKPIDEAFVKDAIAKYSAIFPNAPYEYENLFGRIIMLIDAEGLSRADIRDRFTKNFSVNSRSIYSAVDDRNGLEEIQRSSDTVIVVASKKGRQKLAALQPYAPTLAESIKELQERANPYVFWKETAPGRSFFVVSADKTDEVLTLFDAMKKAGSLKPTSRFQNLPTREPQP